MIPKEHETLKVVPNESEWREYRMQTKGTKKFHKEKIECGQNLFRGEIEINNGIPNFCPVH